VKRDTDMCATCSRKKKRISESYTVAENVMGNQDREGRGVAESTVPLVRMCMPYLTFSELTSNNGNEFNVFNVGSLGYFIARGIFQKIIGS
jgi:hypothetical protein